MAATYLTTFPYRLQYQCRIRCKPDTMIVWAQPFLQPAASTITSANAGTYPHHRHRRKAVLDSGTGLRGFMPSEDVEAVAVHQVRWFEPATDLGHVVDCRLEEFVAPKARHRCVAARASNPHLVVNDLRRRRSLRRCVIRCVAPVRPDVVRSRAAIDDVVAIAPSILCRPSPLRPSSPNRHTPVVPPPPTIRSCRRCLEKSSPPHPNAVLLAPP